MFSDKNLNKKNKLKLLFIITVSTILIALIVYLTGGVKYVYPHLMYIPIVVGGFSFGIKFGFIHALICGLLLGPFMPIDVATNEPQLFYNWFSRMIIFMIVGGLSGLANNIYKKQRQKINESLIIHTFSNIPNPNYLKIVDFNLFKDEVLIVTILIHKFQKIIDAFDQEFHFNLLKNIYLKLNDNIKYQKVITTNNSSKIWMIIDNTNIESMNKLIYKLLKEDYIIDDIPIYFDFSMGYKIKNIKNREVNTRIFNKTDLSAKRAQELEQIYLISPEIEEKYNYRILSEFKNALENNETFLEFQPKISLKTSQLKLEALIRWQHPKRGILPPSSFIPSIEETKLINDLSIWVLNNVIDKIKYFESVDLFPIISINISPKNLFNDEFIEKAITLITKSGLEPSKIEFEITENTIMNNIEKSQSVLSKLKKYGIKIAIDDFGKGFSSLTYLTTLAVDYIKIDKSFIDNITKGEIYEKIVEYTINLSHEIGYKVICEGVETKEQFELLKSLSCDYIQGYYITKPIKANEIIAWYKENKERLNLWKN